MAVVRSSVVSASSDSLKYSEIPGDLKTSIYAQNVRVGGEKEYEKVLEVYQNLYKRTLLRLARGPARCT
jgi:hypothetical protein